MRSICDEIFVLPEGSAVKTFGYDDVLPSLPVPPLHHTLERYLDSVKPFVTREELEQTTKIVQQFETGVGKQLHKKLLEKAKRERNWLEKWWEDLAYLRSRQPLLPFSHMVGMPYSDKLLWGTGEFRNVLKNASIYFYHLVGWWDIIRREKLRPEQSRDGSVHFTMHGFRRLFNGVRVPQETQDTLVSYFKTESEGTCPSHILVSCNGYMFTFDALDENRQPLMPAEWECQLRAIKDACQWRQKGPGLGLLTCDERTNWAKNRKHLEALSEQNKAAFDVIDSAMFGVTLDSEEPNTPSRLGQLMLGGDLSNRWADKSCWGIFFNNGVESVLSDHTGFDGMVSVASLYYMSLRLMETNYQWEGSRTVRDLPLPKEIVFDIDEHIQNELKRAAQELETNKHVVCMTRDKFAKYGKQQIRQFKMHPDSYIQMALQLAYYKQQKRPAPTYETATTREFYHGRTETVRSCTEEAVEWVKSMLSSDIPAATKRDLLRKAIQKHDRLMKEAKKNAGCDRHLLGLQCIAMEEGLELPAIFTDPAFTKSGGGGNYILSTSLVGYTTQGGGVAPMCQDGYGVFYNMGNDSIDFTITSFRGSYETSSYKFFRILGESLEDMEKLLTESPVSNL